MSEDLKAWIIAKHRAAIFDGVALGQKQERERIIKRLEQHDDSGWCGNSNCPSPFPLDHLIALIKGENK